MRHNDGGGAFAPHMGYKNGGAFAGAGVGDDAGKSEGELR